MDKTMIKGLTAAQWQAAYRPGMHEYAASCWTYTFENDETVRLAFGNSGPWINETERSPVFTHSVTMTRAQAVKFADQLLKAIAA